MSSYRQIFKSTALVGGTQVLTTIVGIIRNKALAVMLGPSGMGLVGVYMSTTGLIGGAAGLGISSSGVRQIAEAATSGDELRVARTVATLRRTALISGIIGTLIVLCFCNPISRLTFGDDKYAWGVAVVSLTLLFSNVSAGQIALLQGLRKLREMAAAQVAGAVFGTVVSIALVYFFGEFGVAWFLVAISAFGGLASWWYARRVPVVKHSFPIRELASEARGLVGLGVAFMTSGLVGGGVAYLSRVLIVRELGLDAAGLFQATWALSTYYVSFILGAMFADFSPRLTAVHKEDAAVNRMVNEQVEMGVLIALPGVLATLLLAPWVLQLLYSKDFLAATEIIRWQVIGVFLRVVSWPLGVVLMAKGKGKLFMTTEITFALINMSLLYLCTRVWGLKGIGVAFAVFYVVVTIGIYAVCRCLSGFTWSGRSIKILLPGCAAVAAAFCAASFLPVVWSLAIGGALTVAVSIGCLIGLEKLLGVSLWKAVLRKLQPVRT